MSWPRLPVDQVQGDPGEAAGHPGFDTQAAPGPGALPHRDVPRAGHAGNAVELNGALSRPYELILIYVRRVA